MAEESGFEVKDRRRVRPDGEPGAAPESESAPEPEPVPRETPAETAAAATAADAETAPGGAAEAGAAAPEAEPAGAEMAEPGGIPEGIPALTVAGVLGVAVNLLSELAWIKMGLVANPMTGQVERDLAEAKRAIDALADVARHAEHYAAPAEKRELQVMLSNLRLNFVQQSGRTD